MHHIQKKKRGREKVNRRSRPLVAKQRRKQNPKKRLERSRQLFLARLQVNLDGLHLRQQNRNRSRPSCWWRSVICWNGCLETLEMMWSPINSHRNSGLSLRDSWWTMQNTSSGGTNCHSEAEALAPAAASERNATNQAGFDIEAVSKATSQSTADSSHGSNLLPLPATNCSVAMAKSTKRSKSKKRVRSSLGAICNEPHSVATSVTMQVSNAQVLAGEVAETSARPHPKGMKETKGHAGCYPLKTLAVPNSEIADSKLQSCTGPDQRNLLGSRFMRQKKGINTKARSCGWFCREERLQFLPRSNLLWSPIGMRTGNCDLKTALDYLDDFNLSQTEDPEPQGCGHFCGEFASCFGIICHRAWTEPCRPQALLCSRSTCWFFHCIWPADTLRSQPGSLWKNAQRLGAISPVFQSDWRTK